MTEGLTLSLITFTKEKYSNLKVKTDENRLDSKSELPSYMAKIKDTGGRKLAAVRQTTTAEESKCKF